MRYIHTFSFIYDSFIFFLNRIKAENPSLGHQEAFKQAAHQWSTSPDNPKNQ